MTLQAENERLLKQLTDLCDKSLFGTAVEAVDQLSIPVVKTTRPYRTYEGQLCLGDPLVYDTAMSIDVERWFRTKQAKPLSASNFVSSIGDASLQPSITMDFESGGTSDGLTAVKNARTYKVNDETAPGGKRDVEREELAKGYEYGRTAVHISESDENVTKLETVRSFTIIGFIPCDKVCCDA
jgi:ATP-dependent DNA helicase 2 subunit 2